MLYRLGLDVGITSVGYAVLATDQNAEPTRIIHSGSRIFDAAEMDKDGSSLALPRREARGARRRNRRHRHRLQRTKSLLQNKKIITKNELCDLYDNRDTSDIYSVRYEALSRCLDNSEFARLMVHLMQRRGFKSNRKNEEKGTEGGKLLAATAQNTELLKKHGYRTVGELLYHDEKFSTHKRNKGGDYGNTFLRSEIRSEIETIFQCQRRYNNPLLTEEFAASYLEIFDGQRGYDEGPASGPYAGDQIEKMLGRCTFEKEEKRAVKASYTFELFNLLCKVNSIRILGVDGWRGLASEQRQNLVSLCHEKTNLSYDSLRSILKLGEGEHFNLSYGHKEVAEVEKKAKFNYLERFHTMRIAFDKLKKGYINTLSFDRRDEIAYILTCHKSDRRIREELQKTTFNEFEKEVILGINSFSKAGHLSIKAMQNIIPHLECGMTYDKACEAAGYDFRAQKVGGELYLPKLPPDCPEITSPVVRRAVNQTIKVINAVVKRYGSPIAVNIELARELSKNHQDRKLIERDQKDNAANNERVVEQIKQLSNIIAPTGQDIIKYRLWQEQDCKCIYTGESLKIERLFEPGYCEIDHIIPYSISFNDGYKNKVLVTTKANRDKKNRLPLEYLQNGDEFTVRVNTIIRDRVKRANLLKQSTTEADRAEMKERSLQDTQFISRFMHSYIKNHLAFNNEVEKKTRVRAVNGRITSYLRKRWGLRKVRENGDLHHAVDAVVVACVTQGAINYLTNYSQYRELEHYNPKPETEKRYFPLPWPDFREEMMMRFSSDPVGMMEKTPLRNYANVDLNRIKPFFVSRRVRKKRTGPAHEATIRSLREIDGEMKMVTKTPLTSLKYDVKNDEIVGYYNPSSDRLLYEELKRRLREADGDAKKAFLDGFILKPTPQGCKNSDAPPRVEKVKIYKKSSLNVEVNEGKGAANNEYRVRIDVFKIEGDGYYFIPIYVSDLIKPQLPCNAVVAYKPWRKMSEEDFLFSLYPNDLVNIKAKKPMVFSKTFKEATVDEKFVANDILVYYRGANISTGAITLSTHDNAYFIGGCGIKTLVSIEKYTVDVLGNVFKAGVEKS